MKNKRGLKYYAMIFGMSTVALVIYVIVLLLSANEEITFAIIWPLLLIPLLFTSLVFTFDKIFDRVLPKKYRNVQQGPTEFDLFLKNVNEIVEQTQEISLEEARRLRDSEKFQKTLSQIFTIIKHGENEQLSYNYLLKKFKKDTIENNVVSSVIDWVKKTNKND